MTDSPLDPVVAMPVQIWVWKCEPPLPSIGSWLYSVLQVGCDQLKVTTPFLDTPKFPHSVLPNNPLYPHLAPYYPPKNFPFLLVKSPYLLTPHEWKGPIPEFNRAARAGAEMRGLTFPSQLCSFVTWNHFHWWQKLNHTKSYSITEQIYIYIYIQLYGSIQKIII